MKRSRALLVTPRRVLRAMRRRLSSSSPVTLAMSLVEPEACSVVVLAPHPDDEVIGCGGTILRHVAAGARVACAVVNRGERSCGRPGLTQEQRAAAREAESRASAAALGLEEIVFLPGRNLTPFTADQRNALAAFLERRRPDLVYVPHFLETHPDHHEANRLLAAAWRPARGAARVRAYEVWTPLLSATCTVDITGVLEKKLEALALHRTALDAVDYLHAVRGLAAYRSIHAQAGRGAAEAFFECDAAAYLSGLKP